MTKSGTDLLSYMDSFQRNHICYPNDFSCTFCTASIGRPFRLNLNLGKIKCHLIRDQGCRVAVYLLIEISGQRMPCVRRFAGLRNSWLSAESSAVSFALLLLQMVTVWIRCLTSRSEAVAYWTSAVEHNTDNGPRCHIRCALSCFVCLTLSRLPLRVHFVPIDSVSSPAASCPLRAHRLCPHFPLHVCFVPIECLLNCRFVSTSFPLRTHRLSLLPCRFVSASYS